jgi:hypothetical protein
MTDDNLNSYDLTFKNVDYSISMYVESETNEKLCLEIEDKISAERWKGVFDSTCKFEGFYFVCLV